MTTLADLSRHAGGAPGPDAIATTLRKAPEERTRVEQRRINNLAEKEALKGKVLWDSSTHGTANFGRNEKKRQKKNTPQDANPERHKGE